MRLTKKRMSTLPHECVRPKLAVIGTGAAGLGALTALLDGPSHAEITVFDVGKPVVEAPVGHPESELEIADFYYDIYREIRASFPFKFPPPKTHFAEMLPKDPVGKKRSLFRSESFGGLTNYWGGTMLPYTDRELARWPCDSQSLKPYYERLAATVGISGRSDALNQYFSEEFWR